MKRHQKHNIDENKSMMEMSRKEMDNAWADIINFLRSDGIVTDYDKETGKGKVLSKNGDTYDFTAKRKYMKIGIPISFLTGRTRCYNVRREKIAVIK